MLIKKVYDEKIFENIKKSQRSVEDLIREILSKMCPSHGLHANIEIKQEWEITISACCEEFHELLGKIIYRLSKDQIEQIKN
jgi:hypothetical protein